MRALVQSTETGRFLSRDRDSGCAVWVRSLREALVGGLIEEEEHLFQLIEDHCDFDGYQVVDFDALGVDLSFAGENQ